MSDEELKELIEELTMEADAIGIGSGAPTARLLRRAAAAIDVLEDRYNRRIEETAVGLRFYRSADIERLQAELEQAQSLEEVAIRCWKSEVTELKAHIRGLTAEAQQWHGELETLRERYEKLREKSALCTCPLCPDRTHGGELGDASVGDAIRRGNEQ